ncbi:tail assembly chaperone [Vibrio phage 5P1c]|nr:conserved hypothetical protein [Vibrio phage 495E54-1]CAH9012766.1 conserved hypothetical protein [Vibrio phage 277E43-1]CAH9012878.1 conserved hypothetical protein [Vibrio phage 496E54-1]CAH9016658.1 conserved hypothetical protein [Vibrio phage 193E37-1]
MTKDFRKQDSLPPEMQAAFQKAHEAKEKINRRTKEVEVGGKTYVIRKWKNMDCLNRMPNFANLIYVPMMGTVIEGNMSFDDVTPALMLDMMFRRLQDIDMEDFIKDSLDSVFLKGKETPVDIDEDFEDPLEVITVLEAVFSANFMIGSCNKYFSIGPQIAGMKEMLEKTQQN